MNKLLVINKFLYKHADIALSYMLNTKWESQLMHVVN